MHEERYQIGALLGRGGMAEVYSGIDCQLRRPVAIKRLREDRALDPTFRARFRREATAAARLNHPGIVAVLDTAVVLPSTGSTPVPIIVMELIDGSSLRELLRDGPRLTLDRALEITDEVLRALAASHTAGIIHRDIKPANVLLTSAGEVKVADFGIARTMDDSATQTQTQTVVGSPHYMSPEQARGLTVDHRSDLYSVGCLLYELLVGRPPFTGDSPLSITYQHVTEPPEAPSTLVPELPAGIDTMVMRALEKAPGDRYQSADQMWADIHRVRSGHQLATPAAAEPTVHLERTAVRRVRATVPHQTRRLASIVAMAVLVVIGLVGFGYLRSPSPVHPSTTEVPAVLGFSQAQAESLLRNAHLVPRVEPVNGLSATRLTVTEQFPAGGRRAETNSTVTIQISTGPASASELPADSGSAVDPGEGTPASPDSRVTLTSTGPTEQPAKPTSTAGRRNPVNTSTSRTARAPSSDRANTTSADRDDQQPGMSKASKSGKAKSRPSKSSDHPNNRN